MFGINDKDLEFYNRRLEIQKTFLANNTFVSNSGQFKSYLDISYSANFSRKYYAEVANRINSLYQINQNLDNVPIFLTITLNGCFRDALKGDFSRFQSKDIKSLPYDLKYKYDNNIAFNIKDLVYLLNHLFTSFMFRNVFRKIKSFGYEVSYIRVFEPHKKDGVPHIHALLFIPELFKLEVLNTYKKVFYAPQNLRTDKITYIQKLNAEINGFQWSLNNAVGYVMKYIQKTFIDFQKEDKLSYLSCWYVKYKVRRFITSRSLVPLWVYRKVFYLEKDLYYLTEQFRDKENVIFEWDFEKQYIFVKNFKTNFTLLYENGFYEYKYKDKIIYSNTKKQNKQEKFKSMRFFQKPTLKSKIKQKSSLISVEIIDKDNNKKLFYLDNNNELKKIIKPISKMKNYELYNYYKKLDIENVDLKHFALVKNECINRKLIEDIKISPDLYNVDFDIKDFNASK